MDPLRDMPFAQELRSYLAGADHCDAIWVEAPPGAGPGGDDAEMLARFVSAALTYQPAWLRLLYGLRAGLARLLGLRHEGMTQGAAAPEAVCTPGARLGPFAVAACRAGQWWVGRHQDRHLAAHLVMARVGPPGPGRWWVATAVFYKGWRGPLYFNLIKPFHHLVVRTAAKHAAHQAGRRLA